MRGWDPVPQITPNEINRIRSALQTFGHCTRLDDFRLAGVHASGDFPSVAYADSFVYVTVAHGLVYVDDAVSGLREQASEVPPLAEFTWIPEDPARGAAACDRVF